MCGQSVLSIITKEVAKAAKESLGDKLNKVILYGSYARGDHDIESDIDIMILADIPHENCWKEYMKISELIGWLDLRYDILISIHVTDCATFDQYVNVLPFYMNVLKEGIEYSA